MTDEPLETVAAVTELSKPARRVLGVLVEKAFTTPEYYPLTLKGVTTGCNQKSNRSPIVDYDEDTVYDILDNLREQGLVAVVHTETGRTERFRHYMRKRFTFTEPQLGILTELLLRGRQQLGELRSRAGRMVPIDSLEQLREELTGLIALGMVQANGSLERRGIEVDHNLYTEKEGIALSGSAPAVSEESSSGAAKETASAAAKETTSADTASPVSKSGGETTKRIASLEATVARLQQENSTLRGDLDAARNEIKQLAEQFNDLRRDLGG